MKNERGLSIVELLVTVVLIGILCKIMLLSASDFKESFSQSNTRYQLDADLRRLRNEAVASGARGILTVASNGKSYSLGLDYSPFASTAVADTVFFSRNLEPNVGLTTSRTVLFNTRGYVSTETGTLTTVLVSLRFHSTTYFTATLYSTGALS